MHKLNQKYVKYVSAGSIQEIAYTTYQYISGQKLGSWIIGQDCSKPGLVLEHHVCITTTFLISPVTIGLPIYYSSLFITNVLNRCNKIHKT